MYTYNNLNSGLQSTLNTSGGWLGYHWADDLQDAVEPAARQRFKASKDTTHPPLPGPATYGRAFGSKSKGDDIKSNTARRVRMASASEYLPRQVELEERLSRQVPGPGAYGHDLLLSKQRGAGGRGGRGGFEGEGGGRERDTVRRGGSCTSAQMHTLFTSKYSTYGKQSHRRCPYSAASALSHVSGHAERIHSPRSHVGIRGKGEHNDAYDFEIMSPCTAWNDQQQHGLPPSSASVTSTIFLQNTSCLNSGSGGGGGGQRRGWCDQSSQQPQQQQHLLLTR